MYLFMCVECMIKKKLIPQKGTAKEREREKRHTDVSRILEQK